MARKVTKHYVAKDLSDALDFTSCVGGSIRMEDGELRVLNHRQMRMFEKEHPEYKGHPELHCRDNLIAMRAWGHPDDCIIDNMKVWSNDGKTSVGADYIEQMLKGL